jgi:hypothetical protein
VSSYGSDLCPWLVLTQRKHVNPLRCWNLEAVERDQIVVAVNSSSDTASLLCVCSSRRVQKLPLCIVRKTRRAAWPPPPPPPPRRCRSCLRSLALIRKRRTARAERSRNLLLRGEQHSTARLAVCKCCTLPVMSDWWPVSTTAFN